MYEHSNQKLLSSKLFYSRLIKHALVMLMIILVSLLIGVLGYHFFAGLGWVDSLYNASMILTGMGPVAGLTNPASKIFASLYALFSAVAFLTGIAVVLAPLFHRFLHKFHIDLEEDEKDR